MLRVLFVDLDDVGMAAMAAALFQQFMDDAGHKVAAESCGIDIRAGDGQPLHPMAAKALGNVGLDVPHHKSRRWNDPAVMLDTFDFIFCTNATIMDGISVKVDMWNRERESEGLKPTEIRVLRKLSGGEIQPPVPNEGSYRNCAKNISEAVRGMAGQLVLVGEPTEST